MKRINFLFLFFLISTLSVMAQDDEKAAIIKVIEDEHKYSSEWNLEKMAATFDQSESLLWGNGLSWSAKGWDPLSKLFKDHIANNPDPRELQEFYNYDITIAGNRAWVVFEKKDKGDSKAVSKELRILVKRGEEWKIAALLFMGI